MTAIDKAREAQAWECDKWPSWLHALVNKACEVSDRLDMSMEQAMAYAALSALDQPSGVRVGVKPLEWRVPTDRPDEMEDSALLIADGLGGHYAISHPQKVGPKFLLWWAHDPFQWTGFDTTDAAKAAAQANYEHRILSALDLSAIGAVLAAGKLMVDDHQTSEKHHPNHVLVSLSAFEAMRDAVAMLAAAPSPPEPRS